MEEEARVEISLENRFKEALRKAKEVRENIRYYNGEPSVAECLAYDMQYVEKYVKQLEEENTEWRAKWIIEMARVEDKEKEILHWKGQYHLLSRKINVIPKSKVKEKIEELEKQYEDYSSKWEKSGRDKAHPFYRYLVRIEAEIDILQELLREE